MRIRQMSDLHLELDSDFFPANQEKADILMLNGDVCVANYFSKGKESPYFYQADMADFFFERVSKEYENTLYTAGNHEHYRGYINKTDDILREVLAKYPNIHYLSNEKWEKDGVTFLGGTLWTDMNNNEPYTAEYLTRSMNDFRIINWKKEGTYGGKFTTRDAASIHKDTLKFFDKASEGLDKVVIMSHHAPSFKSVHSRYHNDTQMNYGYYSNLDEFILARPQIKLWTHGHMHDCFDYMIGDTRVVCNPRGYRNENKFFKYDQILEV